MFGGNDQATQAAVAQANQVRDYNLNLTKTHLHNIVKTNYNAGIMNTQLGLQKKQLAQQGFEIGAAGLQAAGQAEAIAAASGSVGGSVQAVSSDVAMKVGQAEAVQAETYEQLLTTYNDDLKMLAFNAESEALANNPQNIEVQKSDTFGNSAQMLLGGVSQLAGNMSLRTLSLGLGSSSAGSSWKFDTGAGSGFNTANWGVR